MLSGRCVALGCPRRLSPHSTACTHSSVGGLITMYRVSSLEMPCACSPHDNEAVLVTAERYRASGCRGLRTTSTSVHSNARSVCGSTLGARDCNIRSISTCCVSKAGSGVAMHTCRSKIRTVWTLGSGPPSHNSYSSSNMYVIAAPRCCDAIPVTSRGDRGRGCDVRNHGNGTATVAWGIGNVRNLVDDTTQENWLTPLRRPGSVVALGKFDALHRGHCALAAAAAALVREISAEGSEAVSGGTLTSVKTGTGSDTAAIGDVVLLSFSGMAAVLGWPDRLPLTAPQDRGRVLSSWSAACGSGGANGNNNNNGEELTATTAALGPPRLRTLPFSLIRSMSPEQFVALLARDLGAAGVVAGQNYRFGYKAAGDADTLVRLGQRYGMRVAIVDLVTLPDTTTATSFTTTAWSGDLRSSSSSGSSNSNSSSSSHDFWSPDRFAARSHSHSHSCDPPREVTLDSHDCHSVLEVKEGAGKDTAYDRSNGNGGGSGGSEGGGITRAESTSSRVSSSRIRVLLEQGKVESVEQLLGRKYRLVCALSGVATRVVTNINSGSVRKVNNVSGAGGPQSKQSGCVRLVVPSTSYQNQPPANGHYRALVQVVLDSQVPAASGFPSHGATDATPLDAEGLLSGAVCTMVQISDKGVHVELSETGLDQILAGHDDGLLLLDFDACG